MSSWIFTVGHLLILKIPNRSYLWHLLRGRNLSVLWIYPLLQVFSHPWAFHSSALQLTLLTQGRNLLTRHFPWSFFIFQLDWVNFVGKPPWWHQPLHPQIFIANRIKPKLSLNFKVLVHQVFRLHSKSELWLLPCSCFTSNQTQYLHCFLDMLPPFLPWGFLHSPFAPHIVSLPLCLSSLYTDNPSPPPAQDAVNPASSGYRVKWWVQVPSLNSLVTWWRLQTGNPRAESSF